MLSASLVNGAQAKTYFEHTEDYYTKNLSNRDRWYGTQAKALGLGSEMSKEQFDVIVDAIQHQKRKRIGLDLTLSAPKSVSLLAAKSPELRDAILDAQAEAVQELARKIELELVHTRDAKGNDVITGNALFATFQHYTARPTKENNYIPDPSVHTHLIFLNNTIGPDGKNHAVNFQPLLKGHVKDLGLEFRRLLFAALEKRGIKMVMTDERQGFAEVKGFDRDIIEHYSCREHETKAYAIEHDIENLHEANLKSRATKSKARATDEEVFAMARKDLFDSNKVKPIVDDEKLKHFTKDFTKEGTNYERITRLDGAKDAAVTRQTRNDQAGNDLSHAPNFNRDEIPNFAQTPTITSLPDLQERGLDASGEWGRSGELDVLLQDDKLSCLAKLQRSESRDYFVRKEREFARRAARAELVKAIDAKTAETIKTVFAEKYAVTVKELTYRIKAACVLLNVDDKEAGKAIERAGLIRLGQKEGVKDKNQYLTTRDNIEKEQYIKSVVHDGKNRFDGRCMSMEDAMRDLDVVEQQAQKSGLTDFSIAHPGLGKSDEQAKAIYHILTCQDAVMGVDGLAGTGKTTMCERLKWVADKEDITVRGICFTGKAADGLQNESGIESNTIHGFLNALEKGQYNDYAKDPGGRQRVRGKVPAPELYWHSQKDKNGIKQSWDFSKVTKSTKREIWLVDEAGLVDMHLAYQLIKGAEARGAQIVLMGDPKQLPPVGTGAPMETLEKEGMPTAYLNSIRRQNDADLLQAVRESVDGDHLKTFELLDKKGDYIEIKKDADRKKAVVADMVNLRPQNYLNNGKLERLLLVSTNKDRKFYNDAIRNVYVEHGWLQEGDEYSITTSRGDEMVTEKRHFAADDRIIFTANDNKLGVKNGTMGQIMSIDDSKFVVRTDAGKVVTFDISDYDRIDHSYAVTEYKSQGMTVNKVIADMPTHNAPQNRNALYVAISRAKQDAKVYTDSKRKLERDTKTFAQKITGKDFESRINALQKDGIKNNDYYKSPDDIYKDRLDAQLKRLDRDTKALQKRLEQQRKRVRKPPRLIDHIKVVDRDKDGNIVKQDEYTHER